MVAPAQDIAVLDPETALPVGELPLDGPLGNTNKRGKRVAHPVLYQSPGRDLGEDRGAALVAAIRRWAVNPGQQQIGDRQRAGALKRVDLEWVDVARAVMAGTQRLSAREAVRRAYDQGLKGNGSAADADALVSTLRLRPQPDLEVDERTVVATGRGTLTAPSDVKTAPPAPPLEEDDDPLGARSARQALEAHRQAVKEALLVELRDTDPWAFEHIVGHLLEAVGVEDTEVTQRSGDGGIDVRGVLRSAEVITRPIVVQVKRYRRNIGPDPVRTLRGCLSPGETGLLVTLSDFTRAASDEADGTTTGRTPVSLMNGDALTNALLKHQIGVERAGVALWRVVGFDGVLEGREPDIGSGAPTAGRVE